MKILLRGAMEEEIDIFCNYFEVSRVETIFEYKFFISEYKGNTIIISLTKEGIINTTIATMLAIEKFNPDVVVNQGCAGAHLKDLEIGDVIIGRKSVYINDFKTPYKSEKMGSSSLEWLPNKKRSFEVFSSEELIQLAESIRYKKGSRLGVLGSGDLHSKEYDRIVYLNKLFGEDCEDIESVASLKVCEMFNVKKIAMRIISNNNLKSEVFDKSTCTEMQKYVINLIDLLIEKHSINRN